MIEKDRDDRPGFLLRYGLAGKIISGDDIIFVAQINFYEQ
jgi:hypothetical protein